MKHHEWRLKDCSGLPGRISSKKTWLYGSGASNRASRGGGSYVAPSAHTTCALGTALIVSTWQSNIRLSRMTVRCRVFSVNIGCKSDIRVTGCWSIFNIKSRAFNAGGSLPHATRVTSTTFAVELTIASDDTLETTYNKSIILTMRICIYPGLVVCYQCQFNRQSSWFGKRKSVLKSVKIPSKVR